ncbi:Zinc finger RING-type [Arabidopsis thaliana x Arabidopsis arenosa]|uniref:RING-type E3 ubiquitin transferase n=2 Tax=Arabidopsis TaxID=3701 RepID=A0A8T1Z649_ARASU|nr:Zinc finger RING-type [Arabidopsis thaliana x Arabidopsis arenosa]KAG7553668.1 Zinc finger RING-type [Arabidopsis suecica]
MESQPPGPSNADSSNSIPSSACNLCGRVVQSASDDLEIFSLCVDCKFLLLEDFGTPAPPLARRQTIRRRRMRRRTRRSRHDSSESVGDLSTQQFTHLISMARQSLSTVHASEDQRDDQHRTSSHTTPSGSTRWRIFSESESDDFDNFGETESNASFSLYRFPHADNDAISFSAYGGESDASTDRHAFLDAEIFVQPDDRSDIDFDTDIDPMHAGLNQWNSDEEDREWEEGVGPSGVIGTRYRNYLASPSESYSSMTRFDSPELERGFRQRILERRQGLSRNIFTGLEDLEFSPYAANVADYLDERGFEELLEQLAESDNSRRGAPPASVSCVRNLPRVIIGEEHVMKGLVCAICKELFTLSNETTQLPCLHLYHAHCIVPWLSARNSCPLCRYELPTDDKDYEDGKHNVLDVSEDSSSDDDGTESGEEEYVERGESDSGVSRVSRGRWLFLAAAPVVSLVGVVLAMWLSNQQRRDIAISHSQRGNRTRRWLPFF